MIACPACNAENQDGKTFCRKCGASLEPAPTTPCISCGNPLRPGLRFCNRCGTDQSPPPSEDTNATVILSPSEAAALRAAAVNAAQTPAKKPSPHAFSDLGEETVLVDPPGAPEGPSSHSAASAPKAGSHSQKNALFLGGAVLAVVLLGLGAYWMLGDKPADSAAPPVEPPVANSAPEPAAMSVPVSVPASEPAPALVEPPPQPQAAPAEPTPAVIAPPPPPPPAPEPVVEEPKAPPAPANVEQPPRKQPAAKPAEAKPKAPKPDKSAAERKQAEEALKRLLGQ